MEALVGTARRRRIAISFITVVIALVWLAGCSDFFVDPTLNSIVVTDSKGLTSPQVAVGNTEQMQAIGQFSDGSRGNIVATWSSSADSVATIDQTSGKLTAVAPGTATITAANSGLTGTASVTVCGVESAITIQPINPIRGLAGSPVQFTAMAGGNDVTNSVVWSSSDTTVATMSNSAGTNGQASLLKAGTTTISANSCSFTSSTTLTVTNP